MSGWRGGRVNSVVSTACQSGSWGMSVGVRVGPRVGSAGGMNVGGRVRFW